jgi:hypothetical protein
MPFSVTCVPFFFEFLSLLFGLLGFCLPATFALCLRFNRTSKLILIAISTHRVHSAMMLPAFDCAGQNDESTLSLLCLFLPLSSASNLLLMQVTGQYLTTDTGSGMFNANNCGQGCPIAGQTEIAATSQSRASEWKTLEGVYFSPRVD